jgi:hypothetical protein
MQVGIEAGPAEGSRGAMCGTESHQSHRAVNPYYVTIVMYVESAISRPS